LDQEPIFIAENLPDIFANIITYYLAKLNQISEKGKNNHKFIIDILRTQPSGTSLKDLMTQNKHRLLSPYVL